MKILFHSNQLCLRGTSVALYDYAHFNETLLGNESYILFNHNSNFNDQVGISKFTSRFGERVYGYHDFKEINSLTDTLGIDFCYFSKAGNNDGHLSNIRNGIHAVFQSIDFHGDIYAYISEWLSRKMTGGKSPYVPYMVYMPEPNGTIRVELGIPEDSYVFGRYGGFDQFDIRFVTDAVIGFVETHPNVYFMFANTYKFIDHPRIKFLRGFSDMQMKANFVASCDAMIHGRAMGESFGLAICEFLYGNKPVLAWRGGSDQHHTDVLKDDFMLYSDKEDLLQKLSNIINREPSQYRQLVEKFNPELVMNKFKEVFLT